MLDWCKKKLAKNTNSDSFIHKHLCGFGKGTKCFKFMAYHATRKFRKVAIKTKLNVVSKQPSHFHHLLYINGLPGSLFSYISYHEDLQSVSKSRAYTMSFLYVRTQNTQQNWMVKESPLELNLIFSSSFCRRNWGCVYLVSIKAIHQGSAFNSTWMTEYFFHLKGHGAKPVAWCIKTSTDYSAPWNAWPKHPKRSSQSGIWFPAPL